MSKFADEVILVPEVEMLQASLAERNPPRARKAWRVEDESTLAPFDGFEGFLVRTALIRASTYGRVSKNAPKITCSEDAVKICNHLRTADQENVVAIALAVDNSVVAIHSTAIGVKTKSQFSAQDVAKVLLLTGAVGVVILHNHPSGNPAPSSDDLKMSRGLSRALDCLGYTLVDSIVVGYDSHFSFLDHGIPFSEKSPE